MQLRSPTLLITAIFLQSLSGLANAAELTSRAYQIDAQPVSTALKAFAAQAGMQLIFTEADVGAARTTGFSGTRTPHGTPANIVSVCQWRATKSCRTRAYSALTSASLSAAMSWTSFCARLPGALLAC